MNSVEIKNLTKSYPGKLALKGVSFKIAERSVHGFLGPNGAGKTTTMNILCGLLRKSSGEVIVQGQSIDTDLQKLKTNVGFLPESFSLYPEMTVEGFLLFKAQIYGAQKKQATEKVNELIDKLKLGECAKRLIAHLSKGQKQRVGIASAIVFNPSLLVLDEPLSGLDPKAMKELRELFIELKKDHTILFSSHQLNEVSRICDSITVINEGEIIASGSVDEVRNKFAGKSLIEFTIADVSLETIQKEKVLLEKEFEVELRLDGNKAYFSTHSTDELRPKLNKKLVELDIEILSLQKEDMGLEDLFLSMTGDKK